MNITFSIKSLPNAFADAKSQVCGAILHSLPDWFGIPEAIDDYAKSVKDKPFWAAYNGEQAVGFIALTEHNPYTAEVHVMGIDHSCLRRGIGKRLIEAAEQYCHERGKTMLLVKTIDFSHPDIFYAATRAFYLSMGFVPLQVLNDYWDEGNPCLLMGKCFGHALRISAIPVGTGSTDCSGIIRWAKSWDWKVGKHLAECMLRRDFTDWESLIAAEMNGEYMGLCALIKKDAYGTDLHVSPFISSVYVDPSYRGRHLTEKLLSFACNYARSLGFDAVYLISNEKGLYEKYGFEPCMRTVTVTGRTEPVFRKLLS